jgi:hypothetical protein
MAGANETDQRPELAFIDFLARSARRMLMQGTQCAGGIADRVASLWIDRRDESLGRGSFPIQKMKSVHRLSSVVPPQDRNLVATWIPRRPRPVARKPAIPSKA